MTCRCGVDFRERPNKRITGQETSHNTLVISKTIPVNQPANLNNEAAHSQQEATARRGRDGPRQMLTHEKRHVIWFVTDLMTDEVPHGDAVLITTCSSVVSLPSRQTVRQ